MKYCIIPRKKQNGENDFSVEVFTGIEQLPTALKDILAGSGNFYLSTVFLKALEVACSGLMEFRFAAAYDGKKPVAVSYYQVIPLNGTDLRLESPEGDNTITKWLKSKIRSRAAKLSLKLLVNGNAFVTGEHGSVFSNGMANDVKTDLLDAMAQAVLAAEGKEISLVVVKDFHENGNGFSPGLKKLKYRDFKVEPNMVLAFEKDWRGFEDYFGAMTKKYRQRGKNILKKKEKVTFRELSLEEMTERKEEMYSLYEAVLQKATFRMAPVSAGYFTAMKKQLGNIMGVYGYFKDEKLIAFRTSFRTGQGLECHYIGLDYSLNREYDLYQNMLFDYIREAFECGERKVIFGRTAGEMKSNFGARPEQMICYLKYRNHASNTLIKPFVKLVKPREWTLRNPFRE